MAHNLKDKTFLLTGASHGIGLALARELDKEGARLILVSRNTEGIDLDARHMRINADLMDKKDIKRLLGSLKGKRLDGLLNVAGIGEYKPVEKLTVEEFEETLRLNVVAPFLLTKALLAKLAKSRLSLVLNIGSGAGVAPFKNRVAYCTSKFAMRGMTLTFADEFQGRKPHFCLITLGSVITTFGGKSIEKQEKLLREGKKAAFTPEWVAQRLVEIIKDPGRKPEVILYPSNYGLGDWNPPT